MVWNHLDLWTRVWSLKKKNHCLVRLGGRLDGIPNESQGASLNEILYLNETPGVILSVSVVASRLMLASLVALFHPEKGSVQAPTVSQELGDPDKVVLNVKTAVLKYQVLIPHHEESKN